MALQHGMHLSDIQQMQFFDKVMKEGLISRDVILRAYFEDYDPERVGHKLPATREFFLQAKAVTGLKGKELMQ